MGPVRTLLKRTNNVGEKQLIEKRRINLGIQRDYRWIIAMDLQLQLIYTKAFWSLV